MTVMFGRVPVVGTGIPRTGIGSHVSGKDTGSAVRRAKLSEYGFSSDFFAVVQFARKSSFDVNGSGRQDL